MARGTLDVDVVAAIWCVQKKIGVEVANDRQMKDWRKQGTRQSAEKTVGEYYDDDLNIFYSRVVQQ
jgi:hypothetical protein